VALPIKSMKSDEYNFLANKLNLTVQANPAPAWIRQITDTSGKMIFNTVEQYKNVVPDVNGMGLRDAIYVLENAGLKVITIGRGKVTTQSISPGSAFNKGQKITIQLS